MKTHSLFSLLGFVFTCFMLFPSCEKQTQIRPNIVFLLADDLGYNELGSYGQKIIKTPHLDKLAKQSMRFTDFYAGNSVCAPSRAVLLTGVSSAYVPIRGNAGYFGKDDWSPTWLESNTFTFGELFKSAGYQSAFVGKWHLDNPDDISTWAYSHSFDFAAQEQWTHRKSIRNFSKGGIWLNGDQKHFPYDFNNHECKDAFYTNFAIDFLENKESDKPFFLFMSYRAPHSFEGPIRDTLEYVKRDWPKVEQAQAAKITLQDKQVGRLLNYLESIGEMDNTIVMYTSDNGAHFGADGKGHQLEFFDSNGNLKGGKRDLYEGGVRVPLLAYWKNNIIPGSVTSHVSAFQDLMPTFAETIGLKKPEQSDGISFLPLLLGKVQEKHEYLNWEFQLSGWFQALPDGGFRQSVRLGKWKGVRYGINSKIELYDLNKDESETNDLSEKHPDIIRRIRKIFKTSRNQAPAFPYGGVEQKHISMDRYSN
jgi:arylsulfatase A-like enzyme